MYGFRSGMMRDRITIRRRTQKKNARGGLDTAWTDLAANLSAQVVSVNGRESVIGNVLQGISVFEITVRYRSDVKPADQILWNGRELNIITAEDPEGKQTWLVIHADTSAPQGA